MLKFSFIILLFLAVNQLPAQKGYIALITEPQIGIKENAINLNHVVNDINKHKDISQVIVLGNITANGKFDEFIWAQEILDGLNVPYFVVGGEKDYLNIKGNGSEVSTLWGDDKKIFYDKNFSLVCLNTIMPEYSKDNHLSSETLGWLKDALPKSNSKRIITFSYFPISKANNSSKFFEMTLGYKLFSFVSKEDKQKNEIPTLEGFYLNRKADWSYLLITTKKDSVIIKKIFGDELKKKTKSEILKSKLAPITLFKSIKSEKTFSSVNVLWSDKFIKTISTPTVFKDDKIFSGFKDGMIICLSSAGKEKWRYDSHGKINNSPIVSKDLLIAATADGDILTLNANTGPPAQVVGIGENLTGITVVDLEENSKGVVTGSGNGNLYCYNFETLEQVWINQISNYAIRTPIVNSKNKIFFQDKEGTLYCLSADNGLLIWKISPKQGGWKIQSNLGESESKNSIVIDGNNLILVDDVGNLFCIDALLGMLQWNLKNIDANGLIRMGNKENLIIITNKNKILTVSIQSKKIVNEIELPAESKETSLTDLCIIGNNILISCDDGWVYLIKTKKIPEKIFRGEITPIVSLTNINGNCLVTDYDGNFTLLKISAGSR